MADKRKIARKKKKATIRHANQRESTMRKIYQQWRKRKSN